MEGTVTKLREVASVQIPADMLSVSVAPQQVDDELHQLALRYADKTRVQTVQAGDIVTCKAVDAYADGRCVLLFTGLNIPGAEKAVQAVLGKNAGDEFTCTLADKNVCLVVESIVRLTPVEVNDALIESLNMEGVTTVAAYRRYAEDMLKSREKDEKNKLAMNYVMDQMLEGSEFAYDQAEVDVYLAAHMQEITAEYEESGVAFSEQDIRHDVLQMLKQGWMAEEFCKRSGYQLDMAQVESETDQMLEMMSLMGEPAPDRETMLEESMTNAYIMEMFRQIDAMVKEKMGG